MQTIEPANAAASYCYTVIGRYACSQAASCVHSLSRLNRACSPRVGPMAPRACGSLHARRTTTVYLYSHSVHCGVRPVNRSVARSVGWSARHRRRLAIKRPCCCCCCCGRDPPCDDQVRLTPDPAARLLLLLTSTAGRHRTLSMFTAGNEQSLCARRRLGTRNHGNEPADRQIASHTARLLRVSRRAPRRVARGRRM